MFEDQLLTHSSMRERIDNIVSFFLYVLIFWLPYSSAVVEICVILCFVLWLVKRFILLKEKGILQRTDQTQYDRLLDCLRGFQPAASPVNKAIFVFLWVCILSVMNSAFFDVSWRGFLTKTLEWFIVYFLIIEFFNTKKHIRTVIWVLLITTWATSLDGIIQFYITHKDVFLGRTIVPFSQATAGFDTPNMLGGYLALLLPFLMVLTITKKKYPKQKIFVILTTVLGIWSLVITFSRGALLGTLAGIIFLGCMCFLKSHEMRTSKYFRSFFLVFFIFVIGLVAFKGSFIIESFNRPFTAQWRFMVWKDSVEMIAERPLLGHGINTYMQNFQLYRSNQEFEPTYAHNCYIQLASETGLLGLFAFLLMMAGIFRKSVRYISTFKFSDEEKLLVLGLISGVVAFLVHSFFDTNWYTLQLSVYFWYMIGITVSIINIAKKDRMQIQTV